MFMDHRRPIISRSLTSGGSAPHSLPLIDRLFTVGYAATLALSSAALLNSCQPESANAQSGARSSSSAGVSPMPPAPAETQPPVTGGMERSDISPVTHQNPPAAHQNPPVTQIRCYNASALDGDKIQCRGMAPRLRLIGIDAPELPGHCRKGRVCAPGDARASQRSLRLALRSGGRAGVWFQPLGRDRYGRTLAAVTVGGRAGRDLSCHQMRTGMAIYRADWDNRQHVARACPSIVSKNTGGAA